MLALARRILSVRDLMAFPRVGDRIDSACKFTDGTICQQDLVVAINQRNGRTNPVNDRLQEITALSDFVFGGFGLAAGFFEPLLACRRASEVCLSDCSALILSVMSTQNPMTRSSCTLTASTDMKNREPSFRTKQNSPLTAELVCVNSWMHRHCRLQILGGNNVGNPHPRQFFFRVTEEATTRLH